jgi:hypothetical protein
MRFSYANIGRLLAALVVGTALYGCGSSSPNDQGTTFTLLGYFAELPDDASDDTLPTALTGVGILISDPSIEAPPSGSNLGGGTVAAVLGFQNNLSAQFLRTDQVFFDYIVPGASAQPPSTNYPLSMVLGAADSNLQATPTSSLPGGFDGLSHRGFAQVTVLPAEIREWLNFHRTSLPPRPFVMTVRSYVSGVTSAGDRIDSNSADLFIQVNDDALIPPTTPTPSSSSDELEEE